MTKVTELVADVVTPLAEARGDELVDVEYVKEKKQYYLRIYVDRRPGGIDIEEIANLSELVSEKLDELDPDPFPEPYILELSSPGLERPIKNEKDWERAKGSYIKRSQSRSDRLRSKDQNTTQRNNNPSKDDCL